MSQLRRYFLNELHDYEGGDVFISESEWKEKLLLTLSLIKKRQPYVDNGGGLYTGVGGIAYMCQFLSRLSLCREESQDILEDGLKYINASLSYIKSRKRTFDREAGFLLGNTGIYAVAAALNNAIGKRRDCDKYVQKFIDVGQNLVPMNDQADEFLVGRAGYLSGALWLEKELGGDSIPREIITSICDSMIKSGRQYALNHNRQCPLMYHYYGREYLGAAHGLSSILQVILAIPESFNRDPKVERDVRTSVDYLLSLQAPSGNFPSQTGEKLQQRKSKSDADELVQWCHGAPGVVYLMAKAFLHWRDDRYLESCIRCAEITWEKGLLWKGPGICHGIAGNAYVFLLLYRLTQNKKYLHRAQEFANFMFTSTFKTEARTPDNPYSLYEGWAGTACFLADLTRANEACFPFMHVF